MSVSTLHLLDPTPFGRIVPAMVTPMKADGGIDLHAAQKLAVHLVEDGADGILVNGTTGESPVTHLEEKVELVSAVKQVVKVPVISGAGSNDTSHTVRMVENTQEAGADAVLVVVPYYSRPSQEGIFHHYQAVNESADKPIIIYDVPARTGVHIQLETYRRLAELNFVAAVKDATGDLAGAVRKRMETDLIWYSGDDALLLPFLSVGAVGVISVMAHAAAGTMSRLIRAFDSGDIHQAQQLSLHLTPLIEAMNGEGFQAVMAKAVLKVRGVLEDTTMRLPNVGPGQKEFERVKAGLIASGLL